MSTNNSTGFTNFGLSVQTYNGILYGTCLFSLLTAVVNAMLLIATKYASAGKSATMAFMRCLCLSDLLIGLFGVFKSVLMMYLDHREMNCFLPESLLITASTALCLLLFWLNLDSYLRLVYPLQYGQRMDKQNIVTGLMALWNLTFVIGFLPQMGWSHQRFDCDVFQYYSHSYVTFVSLVWLAAIIGCCLLQIFLRRKIVQVKLSTNRIPVHSAEFRKYAYMVNVIGTDVMLWIACYLPFMAYMHVNYINLSVRHSHSANSNLIFFVPFFLLRAFISAFIHSYRTIRIQRVLYDISHNKKRIVSKTLSVNSTEAHRDLSRSSSLNTEQVSVASDQFTERQVDIACITHAHRKLKASDSVITMITEEDEPNQVSKAVTKF